MQLQTIVKIPAYGIGLYSFILSLVWFGVWSIATDLGRSTNTATFWLTVGYNPEIQGFYKLLENNTESLSLFAMLFGVGILSIWGIARDIKKNKLSRHTVVSLASIGLMFLLLAGSYSPLQSFASAPTNGPIGQSSTSSYGYCGSASFCIFTNIISSVQYYYAMAGLGQFSFAIGGIPYGGPNNAGAAIGTNFSSVFIATVDAATTGNDGVVMLTNQDFQANYNLTLPDTNGITIEGAGRASTLINLSPNHKLSFHNPFTTHLDWRFQNFELNGSISNDFLFDLNTQEASTRTTVQNIESYNYANNGYAARLNGQEDTITQQCLFYDNGNVPSLEWEVPNGSGTDIGSVMNGAIIMAQTFTLLGTTATSGSGTALNVLNFYNAGVNDSVYNLNNVYYNGPLLTNPIYIKQDGGYTGGVQLNLNGLYISSERATYGLALVHDTTSNKVKTHISLNGGTLINSNTTTTNSIFDGSNWTLDVVSPPSLTRWSLPNARIDVIVGSSPYSYSNTGPTEQQIIVVGGTVSEIDLLIGGNAAVNTGVTSGAFLLNRGDSIKVTYSVAPTMIALPYLIHI